VLAKRRNRKDSISILLGRFASTFSASQRLQAFGKRERRSRGNSPRGQHPRRPANTGKRPRLWVFKLKSSKGDVAVGRGEKKNQAKKQETLSALALDEVGMQEVFQSGKPFTF